MVFQRRNTVRFRYVALVQLPVRFLIRVKVKTCLSVCFFYDTDVECRNSLSEVDSQEKRVIRMYVCMYVWSSHIAEYGSTG